MAGLGKSDVFSAGPLYLQFQPVYFEVANTEIAVPHGLGMQPQGVFVAFKDKFCDIRDGQMPRTKGSVHLVSDTDQVNAVVLMVAVGLV